MRAFSPGVTAIQLRLQPSFEDPVKSSVWNKISIVLLLVVMTGDTKYEGTDGYKDWPQLLSIKVVPSPSVILT